jgi:hypothetical protein
MHMLVSMRGGLGVLNQLAVTLGIFLVRYVHCYAYASEHARGCGSPQLNQLAVTLGIFIGQVCLLV